MSVISDALKAAQRERARRQSQGSQPALAPVLVTLRSKPKSEGGGRLLMLLGAGIVVIGGAAMVGWQLQKKPALPAVPPITSAILAEALAADTAAAGTAARLSAVGPDSGRRAAISATSSASTAQPRLGPPERTVAAARRDPVAVPQGQPAVASVPDSGGSGRLRVAVERPGQPAVAGLFAEAVAAHRAGDVATARGLYDSVLVLSPGDVYALSNLGSLLAAQKEFARAVELLRRATRIAPRNAGVWNNLAVVYREQGRNSDAVAAFRHALSLEPDHAGAKVGLAQEFIAISALAQARTLLDEVVSAHPQLSEAQYTLGQLLEQMQDRAGAIVAYEAFVRSAPPRLAPYVDLVKRRVEELRR